MKKTDAKIVFALATLAFVGSANVHAAQGAEAYPSKPIRLIVPFSPGGSADNLARTMQTPLSAVLGQPIVIDNRGGASSVIGTELAARALPDGYTLLLVTTTYTVNPSLIKKLPYDTIRDFSAMSLVVSQANILAVHPAVPAKSVKELVAYAKSKAGHVTYASGGSGSSPHLSGELFRLVADIELTHVPFKGSGPGVTALLGGQVTLMFAGPLTFEQHIKAGKIRALAVADRKRSSVLPDVPTMAEAGYAGVETGTWFGFLGPAGTPPSITQTVHEAIVKAMAQPAMKSRLLAQGVDIVGAGPREFEKIIREEVDKWAKLVKRAGITAR
ncbi:MAG: tripartite tricarboxylate transporter substrate binding protein [Betaproteobacteria bacterium]|nr:tripartite tricarboxylate transporter substrate binding protein [Betaproteobacteria bacterium]